MAEASTIKNKRNETPFWKAIIVLILRLLGLYGIYVAIVKISELIKEKENSKQS